MVVQEARWQDTRRRLLTIAIGAPIVVLSIVLGSPVYVVIVALVGLLGAVELHRMILPSRKKFVIAPLLVIASIISAALGNYALLVFALVLSVVIHLLVRPAASDSMPRFPYLLFGSLYIGLPLSFLIPLRAAPDGLWWTLALFIANWSTDAFALAGGRLFGRHKLAPAISPGKSVEGALIGLLIGTLLGILTAALGQLDLSRAVPVSLLIAFLSIMGDLIESRAKRFFGVKDTSSLLPGHGGFLDRIDGLVLAIPVVYLLVVLL